jgi:hypothetical protein
MNTIERKTSHGGTVWVVSVLLLSLPSLVFVILHLVHALATLPEVLDLVLAWVHALTGMVGPATTLAACAVSVAATFQRTVSYQAKVAMWCFAFVSLLACLYLATVSP